MKLRLLNTTIGRFGLSNLEVLGYLSVYSCFHYVSGPPLVDVPVKEKKGDINEQYANHGSCNFPMLHSCILSFFLALNKLFVVVTARLMALRWLPAEGRADGLFDVVSLELAPIEESGADTYLRYRFDMFGLLIVLVLGQDRVF